MRALLERSRSVRVAVAIVAAVCILGLVHAAEAGDDLGIRRATFLPDGLFSAFHVPSPASVRIAEPPVEPVLLPAAARHRRPLRAWATGHARPLRIALLPSHRRATGPVRIRTASSRSRMPPLPPVEGFPLLPPPAKSALVSIWNDRTLRSGDAVMLDDGLHVFRDDGFWPHRPRDFVRLRSVAGLDWHLRRTLQPFDRNPPTRWTAIMMPPA